MGTQLKRDLKYQPQFCSAGMDLDLLFVWHIHLSSPPEFPCHQAGKGIYVYLLNRAKLHPSVIAECALLRTQNILCVTRGLRPFVS